jgi:hypothetical protein
MMVDDGVSEVECAVGGCAVCLVRLWRSGCIAGGHAGNKKII